ncbi:MAG: peptidylprolyl isomerase [Candidatus Omnitrophica bacterium]|nr:peptidylprolyl isomerase [Candidatus Omnitrophota bacterium]
MKNVFALLMVLSGFMVFVSAIKAGDAGIEDGSKVAFDYTLIVDGKIADSSEGRGPLEYTQGDGKLIPGLTRQLVGMKAGDEKTVEVKPEEGYGLPDPSAVREIPFSAVPSDIKPEVGMILQMQDQAGRLLPAKVTEMKKDSIMIDLNHPMAGKTLVFKVKIVSVN